MGAIGTGLLALVGAAVALDGAPGLPRAALVVGAAVVVAAAALGRRLRPARAEALGLAAVWCGLAVIQVVWADAPDAALDGAASVLAAAGVFLAAGSALPRGGEERWLAAFAAVGACVAAVALASLAGAWDGARAGAPFGNPNRLAAWLLLPVAVGGVAVGVRAPGERRRVWTIAALGVLVLCVAALAATDCLGAALAGVVAAAAVAGLVRARGRAPVAAGAVAGGLAAAALALAVLPVVAPGWIPWARDGSESSPGIRWAIYGAAARTALDAAPLGVGLGGFADAFAAHRPGFLHYAPRQAHSEPLQALVELGVPLLAAAAASVALVGGRVRVIASARRSPAVWSALAAAIAIGVHALVDAPLRVPSVALGLAALAGLGCAAPERPGPRHRLATRVALGSIATVLAAIGTSGAIASRAESVARSALERGRFAEAERAARAGRRARPDRVALWRIGAEAAEDAARLGDGGPRALARAVGARRGAVAAAPRRAALREELARTLLSAGDSEGALVALAAASRLDPAAPGPYLARARVWLARGRPRRAARAAREALLRHPLATRGVVAGLLRATDDPALARSAVPDDPEPLARAARELDRAGYARAAADAFERALALDPANVRVAVETSRVWRRAGRADRAASVLSRALDRAPGDSDLRAELARTEAAGRRGAS